MRIMNNTTGIGVAESHDFFGLELLARVAESRDESLESAAIIGQEINQIQHGLAGEESKEKLEVALAKFQGLLEKLEADQAKLLLKKGGKNDESLSIEWNERTGYFQIGQREMTDRIYRINIWIRRAQASSTTSTLTKKDIDEQQELQVNLSSDECNNLGSRTVKLSKSDSSTSLRISLRSSTLNFSNFIKTSSLKIKQTNIDSEEKHLGFVGLPDRIATSTDLEFRTQNQATTAEDTADGGLRLNILMYLESSSLLQGSVAYLDQMLQRRFELTMWDQSLLPLCWALKRKQKWDQLIELSPASSEPVDSVPLDLTCPRSLDTAQYNATGSSDPAALSSSDFEQRIRPIRRPEYDLMSKADQCNPASSLDTDVMDLTVGSGRSSRKSTLDTPPVSNRDKETEMETDQSSQTSTQNFEPMTMEDKEIQKLESVCQKSDWRTYEGLRLYRSPSRASIVALSVLRKNTRPKRPRKSSQLEQEIAKLAKNIKEIEDKAEISRKPERSPLNENVQGNILRSLMLRTPSA